MLLAQSPTLCKFDIFMIGSCLFFIVGFLLAAFLITEEMDDDECNPNEVRTEYMTEYDDPDAMEEVLSGLGSLDLDLGPDAYENGNLSFSSPGMLAFSRQVTDGELGDSDWRFFITDHCFALSI